MPTSSRDILRIVGIQQQQCASCRKTSQASSFPFLGICTVDEIEVAPMKPHLHLHPNPCPRTQSRTVSASITACSPLSLLFPLSPLLPLSTRRASSPGTAVNRYMEEEGRKDEGRVVKRGGSYGGSGRWTWNCGWGWGWERLFQHRRVSILHPSRARSAWFRRCVRPVGVGVGMRQFVVPPLETVFVSHDRALVLRVCGALVGREEVGAQLISLRLLLYT
jgi:hypothetical protein